MKIGVLVNENNAEPEVKYEDLIEKRYTKYNPNKNFYTSKRKLQNSMLTILSLVKFWK